MNLSPDGKRAALIERIRDVECLMLSRVDNDSSKAALTRTAA